MSPYRLLISELVKQLGWHFPILVVWTALVGLGEGTSIVLLLPLLDRVGIVAQSAQGVANAVIQKGLALVGAHSTLEILMLVVVAATAQMILSVALSWWSSRLARSYQAQRRLELFAAFMRAKWSFLVDRKAGEMVNAITTESERLARALTTALSLCGSAIVALIYVALSAFIAWQATLCLIGFAIAVSLAMTLLYRKNYTFGRNLAPSNAQLQAMLEERFAGAKFIKASVGVDRALLEIEPVVRRISAINTVGAAMPVMVR